MVSNFTIKNNKH